MTITQPRPAGRKRSPTGTSRSSSSACTEAAAMAAGR